MRSPTDLLTSTTRGAVPVQSRLSALGSNPVGRFAKRREMALVLALLACAVIFSAHSTTFVSFDNVRNILNSVAIVALVAVGEMLVVLARQIDLSVGSQIGLVAYVVSDVLHHSPGMGVPGALALGAALGLGLGAVNGLIVVIADVPAIIATLGTLYVYQGIDFLVAGGNTIDASQVPQGFLSFTTTHALLLPPPVLLVLGLAVLAAYALRSTPFGRDLFAIGSNPDAARLVGIRRGRRIFAAFAICGVVCGVAGVLWGSYFGTVTADSANGFELTVVAVVVVGGVNIFGGSGSVLGVLLAALLYGAIDNGLALLNVSQFWLQAITGAAILAAVTLDTSFRRRARAALQRGSAA